MGWFEKKFTTNPCFVEELFRSRVKWRDCYVKKKKEGNGI
jgi:hypothetical protein